MGCCQTNLASPNHPANINPKNFIDGIKQDGSLGSGQQKDNNKKANKKNVQGQQEYEYSVHGLRQGDQQQSQVSIFDEQRRLRSGNSINGIKKKMVHVQIHPQMIVNENINKVDHNENSLQQTHNRAKTFQQAYEEFHISRIDLLHPENNIQHQDSHFLNKEIISSTLIHQNSNKDKFLEVKSSSKAIYNQTDRQLVELNEELSTMIVLWDQKAVSGQKLRISTVSNQQLNGKNNQQQPLIPKLQSEHQPIEADEDLQQIWNTEPPVPQPKDQDTLTHLKNQYILKPNLQHPQANKPNQDCLTNPKLKEKLTSKELQIPQKSNKQNKPTAQDREELKLHLSKMKARKQQPPNKVSTDSDDSDEQSDGRYSRCLLSNPTRILNDSLTEEFSLEKEIFYFCLPNSYKKWIENDRKAFEVNKDLIKSFLMKNDSNHIATKISQAAQNIHSSHLTRTFCILLSLIRDYNQLAGINLISYRTFSSTSILMQPQQRQQNYSGFRSFFNGTKRIFPFSHCFDCTKIGSQLYSMISHFYSQQKNPAQLLYNLTGWIPEYIVVDEINNFEGIFERLNNNFVQGNTIISFNGRKGEAWGLRAINLDNKEIILYGKTGSYQYLYEFEQKHSWQQFITKIQSINVNWNPLIYDYVWKTQNIFFQQETTPSHFDPSFVADKSHQYLLKIPPSDSDIELRVFLETHYDHDGLQNSQKQPLIIELYDYMGTKVHFSSFFIRKLDKKKTIYSDVLIFEGSRQRTEYVLLVRPEQPSENFQIKYTLSAYSFCEVGLSELPQQRIIEQKQIKTFLQQSHYGQGINSPYFLDNFYMQLKVPSMQQVRIYVQMPSDECSFEINLISNPEKQQNLTRLNLQTILSDFITSEEFGQGKGCLQVQAKHNEYFLMLTNHTKCKGEFKIVIQVLQKQPKSLTKQKLQQLQLINANKDQFLPKMISYKQRFFYEQPLSKKQFKWSPVNTGPRKRLKSNTHSGYQPYVTFKDFFRNPYTDFKLQKDKKYQFSVVSKSYEQQYNELSEDDKNEAEPPTLSLGILKILRPNEYQGSQNDAEASASFKIVVDDAFYVPFGFGFWTKVMEFEEGEYRFVFPRMQKESGTGIFCIYEVKEPLC